MNRALRMLWPLLLLMGLMGLMSVVAAAGQHTPGARSEQAAPSAHPVRVLQRAGAVERAESPLIGVAAPRVARTETGRLAPLGLGNAIDRNTATASKTDISRPTRAWDHRAVLEWLKSRGVLIGLLALFVLGRLLMRAGAGIAGALAATYVVLFAAGALSLDASSSSDRYDMMAMFLLAMMGALCAALAWLFAGSLMGPAGIGGWLIAVPFALASAWIATLYRGKMVYVMLYAGIILLYGGVITVLHLVHRALDEHALTWFGAVARTFRRSADFSGEAASGEFWAWMATWAGIWLLSIDDPWTHSRTALDVVIAVVGAVPAVALTVRRLRAMRAA